MSGRISPPTPTMTGTYATLSSSTRCWLAWASSSRPSRTFLPFSTLTASPPVKHWKSCGPAAPGAERWAGDGASAPSPQVPRAGCLAQDERACRALAGDGFQLRGTRRRDRVALGVTAGPETVSGSLRRHRGDHGGHAEAQAARIARRDRVAGRLGRLGDPRARIVEIGEAVQ